MIGRPGPDLVGGGVYLCSCRPATTPDSRDESLTGFVQQSHGDGKISDRRGDVFTDWAAGASDDMEALRAAFDSNGDGKLTAADARFNEFRVLVTNADGSTKVKTLGRVGISGIRLRPDLGKLVGLASAA